MSYRAIVVGTSAGGLRALTRILTDLPAALAAPIFVVQHVGPSAGGPTARLLGQRSLLTVKQAEDKEPIRAGTVYLAPPDYHLLVERARTLALSVDEPVCHCRPSIDVLFESAADSYGPNLVGVVLTGANRDGSQGLRAVKERGGYAVVEDPTTAEARTMPAAALETTAVDKVLAVDDIAALLSRLVGCDPSARPSPPPSHG